MAESDLAQLGRLFAQVTGGVPPSREEDLIEGGALDSLALVELLFAIEQELGVEIPSDRLEIERFRTLDKLAALVAECRAFGTSDAA